MFVCLLYTFIMIWSKRCCCFVWNHTFDKCNDVCCFSFHAGFSSFRLFCHCLSFCFFQLIYGHQLPSPLQTYLHFLLLHLSFFYPFFISPARCTLGHHCQQTVFQPVSLPPPTPTPLARRAVGVKWHFPISDLALSCAEQREPDLCK